MNSTLAFAVVVTCAATLSFVTVDPAVYLSKTGQELHSVATDFPETIDLSHADPRTWHRLPPTPQVYLAEELEFRFSSRTRPF
jgi:hypothetical protein